MGKHTIRLVVIGLVGFLSLELVKRPQRILVWHDEFDYTGLPDSTKWSYDLGDGCPNVCGWGNQEAEFYTRDLKNARAENGMLIIEARKEPRGGKEFTSARLVSKSKGDWKYGGWPTSGEIDIMEHVGYDPGVIHGTLHCEKYNHIKGTQQEGIHRVPDCQDAFHVYAIDWKENKINFYIDDAVYHSVKRNPTDDFKGWPFDQRFHLILNIAVGGNWGAVKGVDPNIWPQQMRVDYVRVYQ